MFSVVKISILLFFSYIGISVVNSAKILAVFPMPSISHQIVFRPLIHELVRRGHEVTVITPDPVFSTDKALLNLTEIDVHDLSYNIWLDTWKKEKTGGKNDILIQLKTIFKTITEIVKAQFNMDKVKTILTNKKEHFDLLLIEAFVRPLLALTHIFKIPTIQVSSFGAVEYNYEAVGASTHPFLYSLSTDLRNYKLSNYEKLEVLYNRWECHKIFEETEQNDNNFLKTKFGQRMPTIKELSNNVDMLFLNIHPIWADNIPVPPNVVHIRGIHTRPNKELPKDFNALLNASKNGVVYFSLGTNVQPSHLPKSKVQMFMNTFSQLPYDVIWKWDLDTPPGKADNVKFFKWLPQSDLLRHRNVKVFITQGGLQSTDEAIEAGVPLIGIPMLGDQWFNVHKYPRHKIGIELSLMSTTEEILKNAIETVISNKSYRENIIRLRNLMKDEPQTPLDRAVWWTEYVIRHGGAKHLRAAGANISWAQYLELELLAMVALVSLFALFVIISVLYIFSKFISSIFRRNLKIKVS